MRRVRVTIVAVKKQQVLRILSVFVASVIKHAKRMHRIILPSVTCLTSIIFHIISQTARISGKI